MKKGLLFQKTFVLVILFLLCIASFRAAITRAELVAESDIFEIAVPFSGQTLDGAGSDYQDIAVAKDGSFVVTWVFKSESALATAGKEGPYTLPVYARRFSAEGTPLTDVIEVCDSIPEEDNTWNISPIVACDDNGNFVVCWSRLKLNVRITDSLSHIYVKDLQQIYARMFDMDGNPRDAEFQISEDSFGGSSKANAVAMNGDGEFVVTWNGDRPGRLQEGDHLIFMKRFNSAGQPKDSHPVKVNTAFGRANQSNQLNSRPSVAINANGGFAISWSTRYVLFSPAMIPWQGFMIKHMVRRYNQSGVPVGLARKVNVIQNINVSAQTTPSSQIFRCGV